MASKLNIYNLAFAHLGEATVDSLTDDPVSPNVAKANAQWDMARQSALVRAPWLCGLVSQTLTPDVEPVGGWNDPKYACRYTLPKGTLKVWSVDACDDDAWQRGVEVDANGAVRMVIKCNLSTSIDVELQMDRPPEALTPLLVDGLAKDLAARLAGPILKSEQRAAQLQKTANEAFLLAEASEAGEVSGQAPVIGMGALARARRSAL